ncbi:SGNH/GDSL hydrolase family protein [Microbacterium sp. bgisy203]|uniref:SGNH/GDSL hydrolase family protein n=1 Tax=Microbacterium sp. bgisy203 TaxID=3413799 RepID=UPI003D71DC76
MTLRTSPRVTIATAIVLAAALGGCTSAPAPRSSVDLSGMPSAGADDIDVIGVLGDSVSLGVNACGEVGRCGAASWASGDDPSVASVALRVASVTGDAPKVNNRAKDGGTVADALDVRVDEVIGSQPDLVLVLLGGNDVCKGDLDSMTPVDTFRAEYSELVARVHDGAPDARILALSIPDLHRLWEIGHEDPKARDVWNSSPSCRNLLGDANDMSPAAEERRAAVTMRNQELNSVIADVCTSELSCTTDGGALYTYPFERDEISSVDYFHPSALGQKAIAQMAWTALEEAAP